MEKGEMIKIKEGFIKWLKEAMEKQGKNISLETLRKLPPEKINKMLKECGYDFSQPAKTRKKKSK